MIRFQIEGQTLDEVRTRLIELVGQLNGTPEKKVTIVGEGATYTRSAANAAIVTPASITLKDVSEIIPKVVATVGKDKAKALLAQFDATKGSQLKPEQYAAFYQACQDALPKQA